MTENWVTSEELKKYPFIIQKFPHAFYVKLKILLKILLVLKAFGIIYWSGDHFSMSMTIIKCFYELWIRDSFHLLFYILGLKYGKALWIGHREEKEKKPEILT